MPELTEHQKGQRDIREWLQHNKPEDIEWKIGVCKENYPHDKPHYQPYYNAMLAELRSALEAR